MADDHDPTSRPPAEPPPPARWRARFDPLRVRLALLVLLALTPAFLLAVYMAFDQYRDARQLVHAATFRVVHDAAEGHEERLETVRAMLLELGEQVPAQRADVDTCGDGPAKLLAANMGLTRVRLIHADGSLVCTWPAGGEDLRSAIVAADQALATKHIVVQRVRSTEGSVDAIVHLAYPRASASGAPDDALVATYDLSTTRRSLESEALPKGAAIAVIGADGQVLYRYPDVEQWTGKDVGGGLEAARLNERYGGAHEAPDRDGRMRLFTYSPVRLADAGESFYVEVGVPTEAAYEDITRTVLLTFAGLWIVLLGILALGWVSSHVLIARPISLLVTAAKRIGSGDLGARSGLASGLGEIGELAASFDAMAQSLQAREHALHDMEESLRRSESKFRLLAETMWCGVIVHRDLTIVYANPYAASLTGYTREELTGMKLSRIVHEESRAAALERVAARTAGKTVSPRAEIRIDTKHGRECWIDITAGPADFGGEPSFLGTFIDITERHAAEVSLRTAHGDLERVVEQRTSELVARNRELTAANQRLADAQGQLMQSEKLASIGQLAAGVAHEINNPIGYVYSNLSTLEQYVADALALIDEYERAESSLGDARALAALRARKKAIDLDFLREDLPHLLVESHEGVDRVRKIVQDLKDFSHPGRAHVRQYSDIHRCIDSTLNVVSYELKYKADVVQHYGALPEVECVPSQINQVLMNLLVNAAQAIEGGRGTITIATYVRGERIVIEVADTGKGIAPEHLTRIFDPFFTTKPVGKGTGLGLSLAYSIVQQHGGRIDVESRLGEGTTFRVALPIRATTPAGGASGETEAMALV